jgi:7-keto-8-aminopelargonate synthetase-like enzyme
VPKVHAARQSVARKVKNDAPSAQRFPIAEPLQQIDKTFVLWRGKKLIYFGGCDYFRLSSHPEIIFAIKDALDRFGLNVAASRFTTGNHELYERLEEQLKRFFQVPSATLVSNGYATNLVLAQALAGEFSHALIDSRAHQSLQDALSFLHCPAIKFAHVKTAAVLAAVRKLGKGPRILLLTDGLFSHNGALAPVQQYLDVLPRGSMIVVDDAHGAGTLGKTGRGSLEALGVKSGQIIQTISLSKAFGTYGGAILGSKSLRQKILNKSRLVRGNTPLPLPLANAAIRALRILREDKSLRARLEQNTRYVQNALRGSGFSFPTGVAPLVAIHPSTKAAARRLRARLLEEKVFPTEIRYGDSGHYFRFAISSEHTRAQLDCLIRACNG